MRLTVDRKILQNALDMLRSTIKVRTPSPLLTCVKVVAADKSIQLTATDCEVALGIQIDAVDIVEDGSTAIPLERLLMVVGSEDKEATVVLESSKDDASMLRFSSSQFKIYGYDAKSFPPVPEAHTVPKEQRATEFDISASSLSTALSRVACAMASESSRYAIAGMRMYRRFSSLEMAATDGRRLVMTRTSLPSVPGMREASCIITVKANQMLRRVCDAVDKDAPVKLMITDRHFMARVGPYDLSGSLAEGSFPPYEDVIPKDNDFKGKVTVRANEFRSAIRRAAIMTTEETRAIGISVDHDTKLMKLWSGGGEGGASVVNMKVEDADGDLTIAFNPEFLTDAAAPYGEELMTIHFIGSGKPILIRNDSTYQQVVMPVHQVPLELAANAPNKA